MIPNRLKLEPGQVLFREGDPTRSFHLILSGHLSIGHERGARFQEASRLGPGAVVGDLGFTASPKPCTSTARAAATAVEVAEFPFDALQASVKQLPAWAQLITKTYSERLTSAEFELARYQSDETDALSAEDVIKSIAGLRLVTATLAPEDGWWKWITAREYLLQTLQLPGTKVERVVETLSDQGRLQALKEDDHILSFGSPDQAFLAGLEDFVRRYRFSRSHRAMIEPTARDLAVVEALCAMAQGRADPYRGTARVDLAAAIADAQSRLASHDPNATIRVDHFDLLTAKGLQLIKQSTETGLLVSFHLADLERIRDFWSVLLAILARPRT